MSDKNQEEPNIESGKGLNDGYSLTMSQKRKDGPVSGAMN
jgi:hypothetical protein